MKIFLFFFALTISIVLSAQNQIDLTIHHKIGDQDFALDQVFQAPIGGDFEFTRLQYYLSNFSITHDGGMVTMVPGNYALVSANTPTTIALGEHNVQHIEAIDFHIGIDPDTNHLDPSQYPSDNPLALQHPDMHWGWDAGYRFLAMEGLAVNNTVVQIHTLGDSNYMIVSVPVNEDVSNGNAMIDVDANYINMLNNLDVSTGPFSHGETGVSQLAIANLAFFVFSASATVSGIAQVSNDYIEVYPNPTLNNRITIHTAGATDSALSFKLYDVKGSLVAENSISTAIQSFDFPHLSNGQYFMTISDNKNIIHSQHLLFQ